jgi:hypothetical protein
LSNKIKFNEEIIEVLPEMGKVMVGLARKDKWAGCR